MLCVPHHNTLGYMDCLSFCDAKIDQWVLGGGSLILPCKGPCHLMISSVDDVWMSYFTGVIKHHLKNFLLSILRRAWQPTPVFLPGESHGQRSLAGCSPWSHKEYDRNEATEHTHTYFLYHSSILSSTLFHKRELCLIKREDFESLKYS